MLIVGWSQERIFVIEPICMLLIGRLISIHLQPLPFLICTFRSGSTSVPLKLGLDPLKLGLSQIHIWVQVLKILLDMHPGTPWTLTKLTCLQPQDKCISFLQKKRGGKKKGVSPTTFVNKLSAGQPLKIQSHVWYYCGAPTDLLPQMTKDLPTQVVSKDGMWQEHKIFY